MPYNLLKGALMLCSILLLPQVTECSDQLQLLESKKVVRFLKANGVEQLCLKTIRTKSLEQDLELNSRMMTLFKSAGIRCVKRNSRQVSITVRVLALAKSDAIVCNARIQSSNGETLSRFNMKVERQFAKRMSALRPHPENKESNASTTQQN